MPQALINVHSFLQDFNPTKFTVYFSILIFSILLSLRLDHTINISYWLVFLPLWIWKTLTILGALIGIIIWARNPGYRQSNSSCIHFKSMLFSLALQLLLLMSEILICENLENKRSSWTMALSPMVGTSLLSISACAWSIRNGRVIDMEFFAAINLLQIVFIALRLDNLLNWSWVVVFVPTWILLFFATTIILYGMIFAAIVARSPDLRGPNDQQRTIVPSAPSTSLIFLPSILFLFFLTSKLDSPPNMVTPSYFATSVPLFLTVVILIHLSFGSKPGSLWWFGMRTDFCTFLLTTCPCLKEFGNTSYTMNLRQRDTVSNIDQTSDSTNSTGSGSQGPDHVTPSEFEFSGGDSHNESSGPKRLFYALRRFWFRNKSYSSEGFGETAGHQDKPEPVLKLNIDTPD